ncbi:MAG: CRISPR-associated helicase Cas3' [Hyphomonadaceae bacterium]|nr:CRISPR-associated helicase Cas3' [Hyphomonadaceae bacterium]
MFNWPGKSNSDEMFHPAALHMLDVGACALELGFPRQVRDLGDEVCNALGLLIAVHDLGKFSNAFRSQIRDGARPPSWARHWELSDVLFDEHDALFAEAFNQHPKDSGTLGRRHRSVRKQFYKAVAWHHGRVSSGGEHSAQLKYIGEDALADSKGFLELAIPLFGGMDLSRLELAQAKTLSWLVNGLTSRADWLASNTTWFPFQTEPIALDTYWNIARERARIAARESGLAGASPSASLSGSTLVGGHELRPMQAAVEAAELPDGPVLALIEDATGSGKTEAALMLAHRMMQAGKGKGLFFALPTTATADSMFARMEGQVRSLFDGTPSLSLAHGRAWLNDRFAELKGARVSGSPEASCAEWLAADRRRALFAEIGVGTVDQALMGVLPTRFQAMRLAALSERIIIVDEAAFGPYMAREAEALLEAQAAFGGSAIVMTATLPLALRKRYAASFARGADAAVKDLDDASWPALSLVSKHGVSQTSVTPVSATCRSVKVRRLADREAALNLLADAASKGAACIWVRNAVDEAVDATLALRARGIEADLLHARFTLYDRAKREADMLRLYGKDRAPRPGRVLVATQVIESSLDLDADVMVSDLAPMDSLIQRAGRLWRHMDRRPADERATAKSVLHILSPDPGMVTSNWLEPTLGKGAWVYPADHQWRTANMLFREGEIRTPERLRSLMEAVYGEEGDIAEMPERLCAAEQEAEGQRFGERSSANMNVIELSRGFSSVSNGLSQDDPAVGTRLGEPQIPLKLYRMEADGPVWWSGRAGRRDEALSTIQLRETLFNRNIGADQRGTIPGEAEPLVADWKDWQRAEGLVARVNDDGSLEGLPGLHYSPEAGLNVVPLSG